jgi:hypothetical protein
LHSSFSVTHPFVLLLLLRHPPPLQLLLLLIILHLFIRLVLPLRLLLLPAHLVAS